MHNENQLLEKMLKLKLFKLAFTAQRDNLLQKNLFDSKLSEFLISCIFVIKMHCFCQKNLKINMFFMFDYVKINRSDFCWSKLPRR